MKYWLILDNKQVGPFELEQMSQVDFNASTPVWYEGLPDWVKAGNVEELKVIIDQRELARMNHYNPQLSPRFEQGYAQPQSAQAPTQVSSMTPTDDRPANYLVWAIIVTLLCNIVMGVIAIIFASKVNTLFDRGDIDGARRNSDRAQWFIIFAIVLGVIWSPFQVALAML